MPLVVRHPTTRRASPNRSTTVLLAAALLAGVSCGSDSPTSPTPPPIAPNLTPPVADAPTSGAQLDTLRPTLTVVNGNSDRAGTLTYDFQVANNPQFASGGTNVLVTQANVPEGSGGRTSVTLGADLAAATQYYWRARVGQSGFSSAWSGTATFTTSSQSNQPPVLKSLVTKGPRPLAPSGFADVEEDLDVVATVEDRETPIDQLVFEWSADAGSISGSGPSIRWRAPRPASTPSSVTIRLTVIERYKAVDASGAVVDREHRTFGSIVVSVHESTKEIGDMATRFLTDFSNSSIPPAEVVREFSDSCPGKQAELADVTNNRAEYLIRTYRLGTPAVSVDFDRAVCASGGKVATGDGCALMSCEWTAQILTGANVGKTETARGTCVMSVIYEKSRWWLCDSLFDGGSTITRKWLQ